MLTRIFNNHKTWKRIQTITGPEQYFGNNSGFNTLPDPVDQTNATGIKGVALSGNGKRLAISSRLFGTYGYDGIVYVYTQANNSTSWNYTLEATLTGSPIDNSGVTNGGKFGQSLAFSDDGNTLIIGHPGENVVLNSLQYDNCGAIYVYKRINNVWTFFAKLTPTGTIFDSSTFNAQFGNTNRYFGTHLAISGDGNFIAGSERSGTNAVGIWKYNGSAYVLQTVWGGSLDEDFRENLFFSMAFDYDGDTLVLGAPRYDAGSGAGNDDVGAIYIVKRIGASFPNNALLGATPPRLKSNGVWAPTGTTVNLVQGSNFNTLTYSDTLFGYSVDITPDGKRIVIGAPGALYGTSNVSAGNVITVDFNNVNGSWIPQDMRIVTTPRALVPPYWFCHYGFSVSIDKSGTNIIMGAPTDYTNPVPTVAPYNLNGSVHHLRLTDNSGNSIWNEYGTGLPVPTAFLGTNFERLGGCVAVSNDARKIVASTGDSKVYTIGWK